MTSRLFPSHAADAARVPPAAVAVFALVTIITLARSLVHLFAPDGGAQSIATVPLGTFSDNGAATVVHLFALGGCRSSSWRSSTWWCCGGTAR